MTNIYNLRQKKPIRGNFIIRRYSMNAKEYLSQARNLDQRIITKTQMIDSLNDLATRCTTTYSDMPKSPNHGNSRLEECVMKIMDLEEQILHDMDKLVDLKKEITYVIRSISNPEYQDLLAKRYICCESWEKIAVDMNYELRYIHKLHSRALQEVKIPDPDESGH